MPTVPTYDTLRVQQTDLPSGRIPEPTISPEDIGAKQVQSLGQAMESTGERLGSIEADIQNQANQVRVTDAMNQARAAAMKLTYDPQEGYQALQGSNALNRPNGVTLQQEYGQKLNDQISQITGTLGNDRQKLMFQQQAAQLATSFSGDVQAHELREYKGYALNTQDGAIKLETNNAKLNWSNPDQIGQSLDRVKASAYQIGQLRGDPADLTQANMQSLVSNVHREVIQAALENNNPTYALSYLSAHKGEMTADDILRTQGLVNQAAWQGAANAAVGSASGEFVRQMAPSKFDQMVQITTQAESGGHRYGTDGQLLTSSAGAKGEMQVLDSTALNPGFGIKPAQKLPDGSIDPSDRARVGRDMLQALLQKYGDPAKAWAAYNAGYKNVDAAIAEADREAKTEPFRTGVPPNWWLSKLPDETQKYVQANVAALDKGLPVNRPQESDFVGAALAKLPPDAPPQLVNMTREQATQRFTMFNKSFDEARDNAVSDAQRALIDAQGDITQVPAAVLDKVRQIAPDKYDDVVKFGKTVSRGENNSDPQVYLKLTTYPDLLKNLTDSQFLQLKTQLSNGDWDRFAKERAELQSGKADTGPQSINTEALNTVLNGRLASIGIDPKPGEKNLKGQQQLGTVQKFLRDGIYTQQLQTGQKFTPLQIEQYVDQQFAKSVTFRHTVLGIDTSKESVPLLGMTINDIPSDERDEMRRRLVSRGLPSNDDAVLRAYWKGNPNVQR